MMFLEYSGTVHPQLARTEEIESGSLPELTNEKTTLAFSWDSDNWVSFSVPPVQSAAKAAEDNAIRAVVSICTVFISVIVPPRRQKFKPHQVGLITADFEGIPILAIMTAKNTKRGARKRTALSFEVDDLFGGEELGVPAEGDRGGGGSEPTKKRGRTLSTPDAVKGGARTRRDGSMGDRWRAARGFLIFAEGERGHEHLRVHRKSPSPEIFDETLFRLMPALPGTGGKKVFCGGSVFPAVAASAAMGGNKLVFGDGVERRAAEAILKLVPDATEGTASSGGYDLILLCNDSLTGEKAGDAVLEAVGQLSEGGVLVAGFPAEALLDYSTNIRMEAPNMRNKIHRLCRTHFILRAAGPLMQPSWDILVMGKRGGQADVPICRWRFTGNGVLPWQKCNEAFSSAPWLLVETVDQAGPAIARCVNYPWEAFDRGGAG